MKKSTKQLGIVLLAGFGVVCVGIALLEAQTVVGFPIADSNCKVTGITGAKHFYTRTGEGVFVYEGWAYFYNGRNMKILPKPYISPITKRMYFFEDTGEYSALFEDYDPNYQHIDGITNFVVVSGQKVSVLCRR